MNKYIKGFPTIKGRIMICGSSTVGPSRKRGFPYTSDSTNLLWSILDYCLGKKCKERGEQYCFSFADKICDYKKIVFSKDEYEIIDKYLDETMFLYQVDDSLLTNYPNLQKAKKIQTTIIKQMNKYGFGLTDAIVGRLMDGTSDNSSRGEEKYNQELTTICKEADITIINGTTENKNGSIGAFRNAVNLYGRENDKKWNEYKKNNNIVPVCSSSGNNTHLSGEEKKEEWYDGILEKYL